MKIALINEVSQHLKNDIIYTELKKVGDKYNHEVFNYGMFVEDNNNNISYVQTGLLAAILLNTNAVDFVVTGCGSGQGASISCNSYPNVVCGLLNTPLDAFLFNDVNSGNAVSLAYSQGFGWGSNKNLEMMFEHLFNDVKEDEFFGASQKMLNDSKDLMSEMHSKVKRPLIDILKDLDDEFILDVIKQPVFKEYFSKHADESDVKDYILKLLD